METPYLTAQGWIYKGLLFKTKIELERYRLNEVNL